MNENVSMDTRGPEERAADEALASCAGAGSRRVEPAGGEGAKAGAQEKRAAEAAKRLQALDEFIKSLTLDHVKFAAETPPPIDWVLPGLPAGEVGLSAGAPGVGKSYFWLSLMSAMAADYPQLMNIDCAAGRVAYLCREDRETIMHHRVHEVVKHIPSALAREQWNQNFRILGLKQHRPDLFDPLWYSVIERIAEGTRLVLLDPFRKYFSGDENDSEVITNALGRLEEIGDRTGAAIMVVHHVTKFASFNGAGDDPNAVRGSSAFTGNVRLQMNISPMTAEDSERLSRSPIESAIGHEERRRYFKASGAKVNHGPDGDAQWYFKGERGMPHPVTLHPCDGARGDFADEKNVASIRRPHGVTSGRSRPAINLGD